MRKHPEQIRVKSLLEPMPKPIFTKEQKVVSKALYILGRIDKSRLKSVDRSALSHASGLLEALLIQDDEEVKNELS